MDQGGISGVGHADFRGDEVLKGFAESFVEESGVFDSPDINDACREILDEDFFSDSPIGGSIRKGENSDDVTWESAYEGESGIKTFLVQLLQMI